MPFGYLYDIITFYPEHLARQTNECGTQTTSRGSLSTFDTTTATLSGRRTVNFSRNTDRKPRSLLLWSLRMTLVPFATASSTSWWDISPKNDSINPNSHNSNVPTRRYTGSWRNVRWHDAECGLGSTCDVEVCLNTSQDWCSRSSTHSHSKNSRI